MAIMVFVGRIWLLLAGLFAALIGLAAVAGAVLPDGGEVAFMSDGGGTGIAWDVYVLDLNTGITANLTDGARGWPPLPFVAAPYEGAGLTPHEMPRMRYPAWSSDGRRIAFHADVAGSYDLYVMDADGRHVRRLTDNDVSFSTHNVDEALPAWSPNGRYLIFHADHTGSFDLFALAADSPARASAVELVAVVGPDWKGIHQLTFERATELSPAWSPDGTRIAYASNRGGDFDIYTARINAALTLSNLLQLTDDPEADEDPDWSPDGTRIAFVSRRTGDEEIYVMNADGSNPRNLTANPAPDYHPAWLPDGRGIVFVSERAGSADLYIMDADGGSVRRLTLGMYDEAAPAPRPR